MCKLGKSLSVLTGDGGGADWIYGSFSAPCSCRTSCLWQACCALTLNYQLLLSSQEIKLMTRRISVCSVVSSRKQLLDKTLSAAVGGLALITWQLSRVLKSCRRIGTTPRRLCSVLLSRGHLRCDRHRVCVERSSCVCTPKWTSSKRRL